MSLDISDILEDWPFKPGEVNVRRIMGNDGREKLQMRIDLGILQMEISGRPDGKTPEGKYVITHKMYTGGSSRFGPFFLKLNYPNYYDRKKYKTGSGIGIHGGRRFRITLGCIRVRNSKLRNLNDCVDTDTIVFITPKTKRRFLPSVRRYRMNALSVESSRVLEHLVSYDVSNDTCIDKLSGLEDRYHLTKGWKIETLDGGIK